MRDLGYYWKSITSTANDRSGRGDLVAALRAEIHEKDKESKYPLRNERHLTGTTSLNCIKTLILNVCANFNVCMHICVAHD